MPTASTGHNLSPRRLMLTALLCSLSARPNALQWLRPPAGKSARSALGQERTLTYLRSAGCGSYAAKPRYRQIRVIADERIGHPNGYLKPTIMMYTQIR